MTKVIPQITNKIKEFKGNTMFLRAKLLKHIMCPFKKYESAVYEWPKAIHKQQTKLKGLKGNTQNGWA